MKTQWCRTFGSVLIWFLVVLMAVPSWTLAQVEGEEASPVFSEEELDQMLAPIALYPDSLLAQVLMASTYPLEVVQADRWVKENKDLKGDALAKALEEQEWDPSVKSLVQFPDVLAMMSEKLDWTQKLGDAFLSQQEDVSNTVQKLRQKAEEAGNLKTTEEQVVKKDKEVIVIEPARTEVVYVPVYNPTVVYGTWWWPAYPPYYYYPPYYPRPALYGFAAGITIGVAWGYAWGHWSWHHHHVRVDINRNVNINRNINRDRYVHHYGSREGQWRHNPEHRKGVAYRDNRTARQYHRSASPDAIRSREHYRGRTDQYRQDIRRGGEDGVRDRQHRDISRERSDRSGQDVNRGAAFNDRSRGSATRDFSNRGSSSRSGSYGSGGFNRGGGGYSRGGGRGGRR